MESKFKPVWRLRDLTEEGFLRELGKSNEMNVSKLRPSPSQAGKVAQAAGWAGRGGLAPQVGSADSILEAGEQVLPQPSHQPASARGPLGAFSNIPKVRLITEKPGS